VPVPRIAAAPFEPGSFDVGLRDLPPAADLGAGIDLCREQFPVAGVDEGVVLQQEGRGQTVFGELLDLSFDGLVEHRLGDLFAARFDVADEVDDVYDAGSLALRIFGRGLRGGKSAAERDGKDKTVFHGRRLSFGRPKIRRSSERIRFRRGFCRKTYVIG